MNSLLNSKRPPVFCPGCSHERIIQALDRALQSLAVSASDTVIVSDIGCSGLFDIFFNTHAFHGLHGRALTYALGVKMVNPDLQVIVTMGDGGMGIGGAHFLSSCRRNADITLLVLNNFNFGMTGGQFSATTPVDSHTSSGFLAQLDKPLDICEVADAAGAPYVVRCSGLQKDIAEEIVRAISYPGFAIMDIWGICPGRYSRRNSLTPETVSRKLAELRPYTGIQQHNERQEYVAGYAAKAAALPPPQPPVKIELKWSPPQRDKAQVLLLGRAGQRIVTAGELLSITVVTGGLQVSQKNEYDITVLRGPSVSEVIVWPDEIGFTGIDRPDVIIALAQEGIDRRAGLIKSMDKKGLLIAAPGLNIPECQAAKWEIDFRNAGLKSQEWALGALAVLADRGRVIRKEMLLDAVHILFPQEKVVQAEKVLELVWRWLAVASR